MPYIKPEDRVRLDEVFIHLPPLLNIGDLEYSLFSICENRLAQTEGRFKDMVEIIGALEASKLEIYRRMVGPYEDTKLAENGDVEFFSRG